MIYSNQDYNPERVKLQIYYLLKGIINLKSFFGQPIDPDIKQYEKLRKLAAGQSEDYTTRCLLNYDYLKNHYRLIAVNLCTKKELDADPKAIQQIELVSQSRNDFRKNEKTRLKLYQGCVNLIKEKLESTAKNKSGTNLRIREIIRISIVT